MGVFETVLEAGRETMRGGAMINPTLYLFGWRIASATAGDRSVLLLCRVLPRSGDSIEVAGYLDVYVVTSSNG